MVLSNYMPDVVVEVAFNAGFATPAAARVWTDISAYVELSKRIVIGFGRRDERSLADANTLSLTLDNSDGRFTPERSGSPYFPNVKLDRPIRVTATPVGGTASQRFVGFINLWGVSWEGTDVYSSVAVTASSRLARLGLTAKLRSIVEVEFLASSPLAYYPLSEAAGATSASDASGNNTPPLLPSGGDALPVVFGTATGPGTDELTAAQFTAGGQTLSTNVPVSAPWSLDFFFSASTPGANVTLAYLSAADGQIAVGIESGILTVLRTTPTVSTGATSLLNVTDGQVRHVAVTMSSTGSLQLWIDGINYAGGGVTVVSLNSIRLGFGLDGGMSHVGVYSGVLTAAQIAAHAQSGLTGFAGERTDDRFRRYIRYAGLDSTAAGVMATGATTMAHISTGGAQPLDLLRKVEATEGGVLFDERDGATTMHTRGRRYNRSPAVTFDMSLQQVEADFAPRLDRTTLTNDVEVTNDAGTSRARMTDQASIAAYGAATTSVQSSTDDPDDLPTRAGWVLSAYKEPKTRVPTLSVDVLAQAGSTSGLDVAAIYALTVGIMVRVANRPRQANRIGSTYSDTYPSTYPPTYGAELTSAVVDYFVEGYSESYGPESVEMTFNVSPSSPYADVLIFDSATRGLFDVNTFAY